MGVTSSQLVFELSDEWITRKFSVVCVCHSCSYELYDAGVGRDVWNSSSIRERHEASQKIRRGYAHMLARTCAQYGVGTVFVRHSDQASDLRCALVCFVEAEEFPALFGSKSGPERQKSAAALFHLAQDRWASGYEGSKHVGLEV